MTPCPYLGSRSAVVEAEHVCALLAFGLAGREGGGVSVRTRENEAKERGGTGARARLAPLPPPPQSTHAPLVTTKLVPTGIRWNTWLNLSGWLSPSVCVVVGLLQ